MPGLSDTVKIIIEAEDRASATIKGLGDSMSSIGDRVGAVTGPLAGIADTILKVDTAAGALGAAFIGLAVNETVKFQDSLYLVNKQLGDSGIGIDEARTKIEGLALAYGANANDVAESMAGFLAAGNDYKTAASLVETSIQLMIAGELDAVKATDYINASLAGFRVPAKDAAVEAQHVGDVLNKLADISSSRLMDPIADAFARVSPMAKDAGLSMEETGAIVARLVDVFQSGEISGTALASGLGSLSKPSKDAAEALDKLGIATTNAAGEQRKSGDILKELASKWSTVAESEKEAALQSIFTKEQAAKFSVVLGDWAKIQDYLNQTLDKTTGATGSMAREVEGKMQLISTSIAQAKEAWRQFLENFGARITQGGAVDGLVDSFTRLGLSLKDVVNSKGIEPLVKAIQAQASEISGILDAVAKNLPAAFERINWSGVLDAMGDLGRSVSGLFAGVDLRTPEGLARVLQGIVDTGETLIRITKGIVDGLAPFIAGLASTSKQVVGADAATQEWIGNILGVAKGVNTLLPLLSFFGENLTTIGTLLGALAVSKVASQFGVLGGSVSDLSGKFGSVAAKAGLVGAVAGVSYAIGTELSGVIDDFVSKHISSGDSLGTWIAGLVNRSEELAATAPTVIKPIDEIAVSANMTAEKMDVLTGAVYKTGGSMDDLTLAADGTIKPLEGLTAAQLDSIDAVDNLSIGFSELTQFGLDPMSKSAFSAAAAMKNAGDSSEEFKTKTGKVVDILRDSKGNIVAYRDAVTTIAAATNSAAESTAGMTNIVKDANGNIVSYTLQHAKAKEQIDKTTESTKKAAKESDTYRIKIAEIDAEIQKAKLEAFVKLETAKFESDAKRVEDTFKSIDNTISNTGDLLGSLFNNLATVTSRSDKLSIEKQIDLENKRRQEALDIQRELAEVEMDRIRAQTSALSNGEALIKIDGSGLEPELEAFMWAILKKIRVTANANFNDYLLGMAA